MEGRVDGMALFLLDRRKSTRLRDVGLDLARCGGEVGQAKKDVKVALILLDVG